MTLEELDHGEKVALVALLGLMARLDGSASRDEITLLTRVIAELGEDAYEDVAADAAALDDDAIKAAATHITRPEARAVLYELLYDMAIKESIVEREAELLDWLRGEWQLPARGADDD